MSQQAVKRRKDKHGRIKLASVYGTNKVNMEEEDADVRVMQRKAVVFGVKMTG